MKKPGRIRRFFTRTLVYSESPLSIVDSTSAMIRKAILPTKANPEELAAFRKLTPEQRWKKVRNSDWTDERLANERTWSSWIAAIALCCSCAIVLASFFAFKHMSFFQFTGGLAYGGAAFLIFAKKSMWCYALDNRKIILFNEWLKLSFIDWIP